ncbi:MAG TPA: hypothetical protein H9680_01950 [Firmicutes bacterium]|nr:hypothetical protein [Bacillota bacterium]
MKEGQIVKTAAADKGQMEAINRFARRELQAEEVYVFSLILCDNEVDRDWERFSIPALEKLAELFVGKSGVFDHRPTAENQTARIFDTQVETDPGRLTSQGEPYTCLRAWAYLLRCPKNEELILEIDGGIKKEVSVGCAVKRKVCGVCGGEAGSCSHLPGVLYGTTVGHTVLEEPVDAYEWSFVAVPAQPKAGVTKGTGREELRKALAQKELHLSPEETASMREWVSQLETRAKQGERWLGQLRRESVRLGMAAHPQMSRKAMERMVEGLEEEELGQFQKDCSQLLDRRYPPVVQLAPPPAEEDPQGEEPFRI